MKKLESDYANHEKFPTITIATLNLDASPVDLRKRCDSLFSWLKHVDPDVFLFQEVKEDTTETWVPRLQEFFPHVHVPGAHISDSGIASKYAFTEAGTIHMPVASKDWAATSTASWVRFSSPQGNDMYAVSTHLAWGPQNEYMRTRQLMTIENWAKQKAGDSALHVTPKVVLGGDLNAEPNNYSVRWFRGEEYCQETKQSTRWTDCWVHAEMRDVSSSGSTSSPKNKYAVETARVFAKIPYPQFLPERRIDYLFVRGYAFGSQGTPLKAELWGTEQNNDLGLISDHYGVWAKLLDIPHS